MAFAGAAGVAATGHDGWGWLIFAGIWVTPLFPDCSKEPTEPQGDRREGR